ncbi:hypothetical protein HN51_043529 [Arachis hypogaea]|nr:putative ion channel [Arachis hypogaea]
MSSCYVAQGCSSDVSALVNIKLVHREGNAVIRRHLESLPLETFDFSRRLSCRDSTSSLRLSGFSHSSWIREMQQASDKSIIISEILDSRTRNLVSVSRISDYVLSNEFKYIFIFRLNTLLDINIV